MSVTLSLLQLVSYRSSPTEITVFCSRCYVLLYSTSNCTTLHLQESRYICQP